MLGLSPLLVGLLIRTELALRDSQPTQTWRCVGAAFGCYNGWDTAGFSVKGPAGVEAVTAGNDRVETGH